MRLSIDIQDNYLEEQIINYVAQKHQKANDVILEALREFFQSNSSDRLSYQSKNPRYSSKSLDFGLKDDGEVVFDDIGDVKEFSKKLRDDAWR